ncbi:MAG: UDP binding domain-containing protein, partial [Actinomycetota bacterium]|nr:UDP binding domain-containing protein [Actinomycetota bacterium]
NMPYYVITRLMDAMNGQRKPLAGSRVLMLGVAYKADIDDMRESPAIKIAELLLDKDADLVYHDPYVDRFVVSGAEVGRVGLTAETIAAADVVLIVTAHTSVDYDLIVNNANLVFDTRNALAAYESGSVVRL